MTVSHNMPRLSILSLFCVGLAFALPSRVFASQPTPEAVVYKVVLEGRYLNFSEMDVKPKPIHFVNPTYPPEFRAAGITGYALMEFIVDPAGVPTQVQVARASDKAFALAALAAMKQ